MGGSDQTPTEIVAYTRGISKLVIWKWMVPRIKFRYDSAQKSCLFTSFFGIEPVASKTHDALLVCSSKWMFRFEIIFPK